MGLLRASARMLMGATYVVLGYDALRTPGARTDMAADTLASIRRFAPVPADDELVVRGNGAVQAGAGAMLALGILPRLSALALTATMVPTTVAGHAFWRADDPVARKVQRVQFLKNMAMVGGLLAVLGERKA